MQPLTLKSTEIRTIVVTLFLAGFAAGCGGDPVKMPPSSTGEVSAPVDPVQRDTASRNASYVNLGPFDSTTNQFPHPTGDIALGREVFRFETFGNEGFWTSVIRLPQGLKAQGVTPLQALALGLSVDIENVPVAMKTILTAELKTDLSASSAPALNNPATTEALIEANAILGISAINVIALDGRLDIDEMDVYGGESVGVTCALCHSITDGSLYRPGPAMHGGTIGKRLDGLANHDLQVGKLIAVAPHSRAFYPTLALSLADNGGTSLSRKGKGVGLISKSATETEVDAYLNDPELCPVGTFDGAADGNGAPLHIAPLFRTDLAAPWGSEGSIHLLHNYGNFVYTALLDPTDLTTAGGLKFLMHRRGRAGLEIVSNYEAILADLGIEKGGQNGYPFVARTERRVSGVLMPTGVTICLTAGAREEESPIGVRVDATKTFAMNGYLDTLKPPRGDKSDPKAIARGREIFRERCTSCHNEDQSRFVPQNISPYNASVELFRNAPTMPDLWPGYAGELLADRAAFGLAPVRNAPGTYDDHLVVIDASNQDEPRGSALPLLMALAQKPAFLHDDSIKSLDELLDPSSRDATVPHPFFVPDTTERADVVKFLRSLDDEPQVR